MSETRHANTGPEHCLERAERAPAGGAAWSRARTLILCLLSVAAYVLIQPPIAWWPVAYVCLVFWMVAVVCDDRPRWMYFCSWLFGFLSYFLNLHWMWEAAPVFIGGWRIGPASALMLSFYESWYFPLMALAVRHMWRTRGWPLFVVLPIVWVASEYLRATLLLDFPWFFLSHSHYRLLSMIQISDLVGAYGVSFVIAAINGLGAELFIYFTLHHRQCPHRLLAGGAMGAALLAATVSYGRHQLSRDTMHPGPVVAVLQGNFSCRRPAPADAPTALQRMHFYQELIEEAKGERPDVFVLPELAWNMCLNRSCWDSSAGARRTVRWSERCYNYFTDLTKDTGAYVVVGASSLEPNPRKAVLLFPGHDEYNSAFVFAPGSDEPRRYDKIRLVPFGEFVPLKGTRLDFVYRWVRALTPWRMPWLGSRTPGDEFRVFEMQPRSQPGTRYRFAIPICYESALPEVSRRFVLGSEGGKQADFLLVISDDCWFRGTFALTQHLVADVFRAVENRVGIARAVNSGISAIIEPQGRITRVVHRNGRTRGADVVGAIIGPVMTDPRLSLYTRTGDLFAMACCLAASAMLLDTGWLWRRRRRGRDPQVGSRR